MPQSDLRPMAILYAYVRQQRFALLLAALLLLFLYGPIVELSAPRFKPVVARFTIGFTFTFLLLTAVFTVAKNRKTFWTSLCLAIPAVICELLDVVVFRAETHIASHFFAAVFLSYVILVLLTFIFETKHVTANIIFASLCVYLLLATLWALSYSILATLQPGAFSYSLASFDSGNPMRFGAIPAGLEFYFSFVTMTTLGYGDIVPVTSAARALATLQAVVGQLYLAVLVARLVGLHVAESAGRDD